MSEDRLARIEAKLDTLTTKEDLRAVAEDLQRVEGRMNEFATKEDLRGVAADLRRVEASMNTLATKEDLRIVEKRLDKLEVNQEEMADNIRLLAEGHAATQSLIHQKTNELRDELGRRIDLVEKAVRTRMTNLQ